MDDFLLDEYEYELIMMLIMTLIMMLIMKKMKCWIEVSTLTLSCFLVEKAHYDYQG